VHVQQVPIHYYKPSTKYSSRDNIPLSLQKMLNCMYKLFANYLLKETVEVYADFLLLRSQSG
jgi:hypothetical protein